MQASKRLFADLTLTALAGAVQAADEVVVYSARIDELIKPVFDAYTAKTGVPVKFITDKEAPLLARLKAEGENTPADMLITVDAGNLWQAEQEGVLKPLQSAVIEQNIPAQYRSSTGSWTGLSLRARTVVYSTERVQPNELTTYEALADKNWEGRLCLRTSKKVYNQSLTATLIETHGAVSEPVAIAMAEGALAHSAAAIAVSVTGVAGPGGTAQKPEGMVCFGLAAKGQSTRVETVHFGAPGRAEVRRQTVEHALSLMLNALNSAS